MGAASFIAICRRRVSLRGEGPARRGWPRTGGEAMAAVQIESTLELVRGGAPHVGRAAERGGSAVNLIKSGVA
jgi:hypothetical protein